MNKFKNILENEDKQFIEVMDSNEFEKELSRLKSIREHSWKGLTLHTVIILGLALFEMKTSITVAMIICLLFTMFLYLDSNSKIKSLFVAQALLKNQNT